MDDEHLGYDRQVEASALWDADQTSVGDVWRRLKDGAAIQQIADEDRITAGPIYAAIRYHRALVDGSVSGSPSVARAHAGRIRMWLQTKPLGPELRAALEDQEQKLNAIANDDVASEVESETALEKSREAASENTPGIYVYTLPHYVRFRYDPQTGRTLLKVGHSSVDALHRANSQARVTSLPEDPWLLRIYPAEQSLEVERDFHGFLRDADTPECVGHASARNGS